MKYILVMTLRIRDTILINPFQILSLEQTKLLGGEMMMQMMCF